MMRRVLITGGSGGIGSAVARACAAHDWWPIVGYSSDEQSANKTVDACGRGEALALNLLDDHWDLDRLADVSAVVHCAGLYSTQRTLLGSNREETQRLLEVNALAPLRLTEALVERSAPLAQAVFLLSTAVSCRGGGPYALAKATALAGCKLLADELAPKGMRVHALVPGWTETPMAAAAAEASGRTIAAIRASHPDGRLLEPDEIGELVADLLSENPPRETGQLIVWDLRDSREPIWTTLNHALSLHTTSLHPTT